MKKLVSIILLAIMVVQVPVFAYADTDYSFLEDMTIKELRALRAEIDRLLGDTEEIVDESESSAIDGLNEYESLLFTTIIEKACPKIKNPSSLRVVEIYTGNENTYTSFWVRVQSTNSFGGTVPAFLFVLVNKETGGMAMVHTMEQVKLDVVTKYPVKDSVMSVKSINLAIEEHYNNVL